MSEARRAAARHMIDQGMEVVRASNISTTAMALQLIVMAARDERDLPELSKVEDILHHLEAVIELAR